MRLEMACGERVGFGQHRTFVVWHTHPFLCGLLMWFLFVDSGACLPKLLALTSGSLQIPPYGRYPCLRLTISAGECIADFHYRVVALPGAPRKNWGLSFATVPLFVLKRMRTFSNLSCGCRTPLLTPILDEMGCNVTAQN